MTNFKKTALAILIIALTLLSLSRFGGVKLIEINPTPAPIAFKTESSQIISAFSPNGKITNMVVELINNAQTSILVEAYSFTSKEIANALINAKMRGVNVKIILDKSQILQKYSSANYLKDFSLDMHIDVTHALFHDKVMIIDGKTVQTGSFNYTKAAETKNAENIVIITNNIDLAKSFTADFEHNWQTSVSVAEFNLNYLNKFKKQAIFVGD